MRPSTSALASHPAEFRPAPDEAMNTAAWQMVLVNGKPIEVGLDASLGGVLQRMGLGEKKGMAVAVNDTVVRRSDWNAKVLSAGDRVLVIQATQGG